MRYHNARRSYARKTRNSGVGILSAIILLPFLLLGSRKKWTHLNILN